MKLLGKGNRGAAYLMPDGRVRKETNDRREYEAAQKLAGLDLPHIVKIYQCWDTFDEEGQKSYVIIEERLFMTSNGIRQKTKERFMTCFKLSWADYHESLSHSACQRIDNYVDFLFRCVKTNNRQHCQNAFRVFLQRTHSERLVSMYHATCSAIAALHSLSPTLEIDMNGGNIGFTADGQMKFFDILNLS